MEKNYPVIYNQNDYGAIDLGNSTIDTIKSGGCFDSCCAMKATFYGHPTDPVQMNRLFIDKGVYVLIDLLPDNAVSQVFPDIKYIKTIDYEPIPTDLNNIKNLLSDPAITLTIRINFGGGNYHFVEAVACDGSSLHIANPISGQIEDFSKRYGNPVTANLHVLVFSGPVTQPQAATTQDPSPLAQRFAQAMTMSNNFKAIAGYLGISGNDQVSNDGGQIIIDRIKHLQDEINSLNDQILNAQKQAPVAPTATITTTTTVATPETVKPVVVSPFSAPTFADGKSAVSSTPSAKPVKGVKDQNSSVLLSGPVTFKELLKGIVKILFL